MSVDSNKIDYGALFKRALVTLEEQQGKLDALEYARREPIAIIGVGCRFPGDANDPKSFWKLLRGGVDTVSQVPAERWDVDAFYDSNPDTPGKTYSRWGAFLKNVDKFDPAFFGIAPREAMSMDPQQRLALEVTWEALENAGCAPSKLVGSRTGVFLGLTTGDYAHLQTRYSGPEAIDSYFGAGVAHSIAAGRISYVLGLHGPNVAIDTACSSSLVAAHLACASLRNKECDLALAGGVNLILSADGAITASRSRMLSFDGRCKTFDAQADGYVRGEGCGVVVFKRLSDALAHGDAIMAVILGSALNQDGRSNGLTAPNGLAQEEVIRTALANAGVKPGDVSYVEAHGTGTSLGDPIEMRALGAVFSEGHSKTNPLMVGSVKTNVGHLEASAGIVGLIKVALALQHQEIPPHLHLHTPNPYISWDTIPVAVPTQTTCWVVPDNARRIAGLSSFGFSGTNAHFVIAEAPAPQSAPTQVERPLHILNLSAKNDSALKESVRQFERYLAEHPAESLADICFTANTGRAHFDKRMSLTATSPTQAREKLSVRLATETANRELTPKGDLRIAFLFTGQGSQYVGMGKQLYATQPTFRKTLERCDEILRPVLGESLLDIIYAQHENSKSKIDETQFTQPALFAIEYALAELWRSWGIAPTFVMGHSVGEYVAACVAGVFSLEAGLKLIAERARLIQALPRDGAMAAVFADLNRVSQAIHPYADSVAIAAINGPENIVISGLQVNVQSVLHRLGEQGIKSRALNVSHAFHSRLMEPMLADFERVATTVQYVAPRIELISNLSGTLARKGEATSAEYWCQHIRQPVQFATSLETLNAQGCNVFVEIGPRPTLLAMAQRCLPKTPSLWLPSLRQGRPDWQSLLDALGELYVHGAEINWAGLDRDDARRRLALPTYPFQRERYWMDTSPHQIKAMREPGLHPLLDRRVQSPFLKETVFETTIRTSPHSFLNDHQIYDTPVFPATGYLEMALTAAKQIFGNDACLLDQISIREPLVLSNDSQVLVQLAVSPVLDGVAEFQMVSQEKTTSASWKTHVTGRIRLEKTETVSRPFALSDLQTRCAQELSTAEFYQALTDTGINYGASFRSLAQFWRGQHEALGRIVLAERFVQESKSYEFYPPVLDAGLQLFGAILGERTANGANQLYVPVGLESYKLFRRGHSVVWGHATLRDPAAVSADMFIGDLELFDDAGQSVAQLLGIQFRLMNRTAVRQARRYAWNDWLYSVTWRRTAPKTESNLRDSGTWLVFADRGGVGDLLSEQLRARGETCVIVRAGQNYGALTNDEWRVRPEHADDFHQLMQDVLSRRDKPYRGTVYFWALDWSSDASPRLIDQERLSCGSALYLTQALVRQTDRSRIWFVTRGAQSTNGEFSQIHSSSLWGFARTLALEHPGLNPTCIDLDPVLVTTDIRPLCDEILSPDREDQIAYRNGARLVARLGLCQPPPEARRLVVATPGSFDHLTLRPMTRREPAPHEIEIQVRATGLNFRDVLIVLEMYPENATVLGNECAGTIVAVGEQVRDLHVGDDIVAVATDSYGSFAYADARFAARKPEFLSFPQAATIPVAFLTAHYALNHLGKMQAGERVLIHAAAGGVGMAAVQLAQRAGAEIFVTAGNDEKRAFLKSLGIQHVMDSRSLAFADEIADLTDGEGVDLVLNSLTGEFISKSSSVLKSSGRFLEIGKRGIWSPEQVENLGRGIDYHIIYLGEVIQRDPELIQSLWQNLMDDFVCGALKPLPVREFPLDSAADAFRFMAQAKHVGKIVLTQPENQFARPLNITPDSTYLITGGLGGIGLVTAQWLVEKGARHLVLLGRRGASDAARQVIRSMEQIGAQVMVAQGDVSQREQVAQVLGEATQMMPPLRGIIHAAGTLDDGILAQQTWERFENVMRPKIDGAWNLHELTRDLPLDFFVLFGAGAAVLGSPGQINYSAANAYLGALTHYRHAHGLPALCIDWGAWSDVGMAANMKPQLVANGLGVIAPAQGQQILERLCTLPLAKPQVAVLPIEWSRFLTQATTVPVLLSEVVGVAGQPRSVVNVSKPRANISEKLKNATVVEREQLVYAYILTQVSEILRMPESQLDPKQSLNALGVDSLMSMELRNRVQTDLAITFSIAQILEGPSVEQFAKLISAKISSERNDAIKPNVSNDTAVSQGIPKVDGLSDEQVDALLKDLLSPKG